MGYGYSDEKKQTDNERLATLLTWMTLFSAVIGIAASLGWVSWWAVCFPWGTIGGMIALYTGLEYMKKGFLSILNRISL